MFETNATPEIAGVRGISVQSTIMRSKSVNGVLFEFFDRGCLAKNGIKNTGWAVHSLRCSSEVGIQRSRVNGFYRK